MTTANDLAGTVFAGCRILEKIGQGGMGSVYKARHETLDKVVCVKLLSPDLTRDRRNVEFFFREARSAAKLDHQNIIQIYNFGQENGSYFIVMSYVEGKTLLELVTEKGALAADNATDIMIGVLEGLAHAHSKGIIHRDIKPSNILVGADGIPRIVDFGLARSISEEKQLTMAGEMVGTAYFMSPEQGLAGKVDARSDLYCAGATYFYILTGRYPFEGNNSIEVIHKHISAPFPNLLMLKPDVPLWVSGVLEKLMRKKPEARYQNARELIDDLKKRRNGEPASSPETLFELSELRGAAGGAASPAASLERAEPQASDRQYRPASAPPPNTAAGKPPPAKAELQLPALHNAIRLLLHSSLALAATACFIIAGASGKGTGLLLSPFTANPLTAGAFSALGAGLFIWAISLKPSKFSFQHACLLAAAAAAAYAGGAYIPAPETADTLSKAVLALKIGLENAFSTSNLLIYSLFLYLAAAKAVFRPGWLFKTAAIAAYLLSLALTYVYFKSSLAPAPEKVYMIAASAAAFTGVIAAATVKKLSPLFNPPVFFLAANALVFAMFTNPMVAVITDEKMRVEEMRVAGENRQAMLAYQMAAMAAADEPQFDEEGRPVKKNPPRKPVKLKPASRGKLANIARAEYYAQLGRKISGNLADSAGIIFISLFLMFMADVCFMEELFTAYNRNEILDLGD